MRFLFLTLIKRKDFIIYDFLAGRNIFQKNIILRIGTIFHEQNVRNIRAIQVRKIMQFEKFFDFLTFRRSRIGIQNLTNFDIVRNYHRKRCHQTANRICNRWTACPATTHIRVPRKRQNFSRKILIQKFCSKILKILRIYRRAKLALI